MSEKNIRIVYLSHASPTFHKNDLKRIETTSRANNRVLNITSLLVYDGWSFVHILEGPDQSVRELFYDRIFIDKRHNSLYVIEAGPILTRKFPQWPIRVIDASKMEDVRAATLEFMIDEMVEDFQSNPIIEWVETTLGKVELAENTL